MGLFQSKKSTNSEEGLDEEIKKDAKENVKRLLETASKNDIIFNQFQYSEKIEEKQAFLTSKLFNERSDIDKPFEVKMKNNVNVIVVPVGSRVEGTHSSPDSDFDYLVVLDIKSDNTLNIKSKSDTEPCFLNVGEPEFPKSLQKRVFESLHKSYKDLRKDDGWKEYIIKILPRLSGIKSFQFGWVEGSFFYDKKSFVTGLILMLAQLYTLKKNSLFSNQNPEEHGPASSFEFLFTGKNGNRKLKYTIDLVPAFLNNTYLFMHSGHFTNNKCLRSAFFDIGSFFVTQRRGVDEYIASFNLSELKLMDELRSNNREAYDAYKELKSMNLSLHSCTDFKENVLSSSVLKTLLMQLVTDESFVKMTKSEIVEHVLHKLKYILDKDFVSHLWFPKQNLFALKKHQGPYDHTSLERLRGRIDNILKNGKLPLRSKL